MDKTIHLTVIRYPFMKRFSSKEIHENMESFFFIIEKKLAAKSKRTLLYRKTWEKIHVIIKLGRQITGCLIAGEK